MSTGFSALPDYEFRRLDLGFRVHTWSPKVCKTIAAWAVFSGLGLSFYILLGSRQALA